MQAGDINNQKLVKASISLSVAANGIATGLIAYKAWKVAFRAD
jgi:hypothetical protein